MFAAHSLLNFLSSCDGVRTFPMLVGFLIHLFLFFSFFSRFSRGGDVDSDPGIPDTLVPGRNRRVERRLS